MNTLKRLIAVALLFLGAWAAGAAAHSSGTYRIPFANGTKIQVLEDHLTSSSPNQIQLRAYGGSGPPYAVVAAAPGVVRAIVDNNNQVGTGSGCSDCNNYVWIEHVNGEWSGYFHMQTGTTTLLGGLTVGDSVTAGQFLGNQSWVGDAATPRLRFMVGVPFAPDDAVTVAGGALKGVLRIPVFCNIHDGIFTQGDLYRAGACDTLPFSYGVYRIPYVDGTTMNVGGDHFTHRPRCRLDLNGKGGNTFGLAAAAGGWIRARVDHHEKSDYEDEDGKTLEGVVDRGDFNNYIWIEHPNGEWTKYSHVRTGTIPDELSKGDWVEAGTYLGDEGDVGEAGGEHLHFEVAVPTNPVTPFQDKGGYINGFNRIPLISTGWPHMFMDGDTHTAEPHDPTTCLVLVNLESETLYDARAYLAESVIDSDNSNFRVNINASVTFRSADRVILRPGFRAVRDSYVHAAIRLCNQSPGPNPQGTITTGN